MTSKIRADLERLADKLADIAIDEINRQAKSSLYSAVWDIRRVARHKYGDLQMYTLDSDAHIAAQEN